MSSKETCCIQIELLYIIYGLNIFHKKYPQDITLRGYFEKCRKIPWKDIMLLFLFHGENH